MHLGVYRSIQWNQCLITQCYWSSWVLGVDIHLAKLEWSFNKIRNFDNWLQSSFYCFSGWTLYVQRKCTVKLLQCSLFQPSLLMLFLFFQNSGNWRMWLMNTQLELASKQLSFVARQERPKITSRFLELPLWRMWLVPHCMLHIVDGHWEENSYGCGLASFTAQLFIKWMVHSWVTLLWMLLEMILWGVHDVYF